MSYTTSMSATSVECVIPLSEIVWLKKNFERILLTEKNAYLTYEWEEDDGKIRGKLKNGIIFLNSEQEGSFKNSSDGGLSMLLEKYQGSGIINEEGEDGEHTTTRYISGVPKVGRMIFDDDDEE